MEPAVADFLRDFAAAVALKRSYDIASYVERGWRDMSKRFFGERPWPPAAAVAPLVKNDATFMGLYKVLASKHALSVAGGADRGTLLRLHLDAWAAYVDWFAVAESGELELPSNAVFDLLNEFVYQFTTFHELRDGDASNKEEGEGGEAGAAPAAAGGMDGLDAGALAAAWPLPGLMCMLQSLVDRADLPSTLAALPSGVHPTGFRALAGYFAAVVLCRLHTKTGDYAAAVEVVRPLNLLAGEGLYVRLPRAHINLPYYAAFSLMMARRFDEALRLLSRTLLFFQRTARILDGDANSGGGDNGGRGASSYMKRQADKMLALLAVCAVVLPGSGGIDEPVRKALRERYGDRMERIGAGIGAEDVLEIFDNACPGFIPLAAPGPAAPTPAEAAAAAAAGADGGAGASSTEEVYKAHTALFASEVSQRSAGMSSLRSYLRLYTKTGLPQLSEYCKTTPDDTRAMLTSLKVKAMGASAPSAPSLVPESAAGAAAASSSAAGADPIHFYLSGDTVAVDEARSVFNVAGFFLRGIENMGRVIAGGGGGGDRGGGNRYKGGPQTPGGGGYQGGGYRERSQR